MIESFPYPIPNRDRGKGIELTDTQSRTRETRVQRHSGVPRCGSYSELIFSLKILNLKIHYTKFLTFMQFSQILNVKNCKDKINSEY